MMSLKIYQVDAFTHQLFGGNPAAIVPLDHWLPESVMQNIALENNLSETAFFVAGAEGFQLRWFTPAVEVDLCGHATLATAHVLFEHLGYTHDQIHFHTRSGLLKVWKSGADSYHMDFPMDEIVQVDMQEAVYKGIGVEPVETYKGKDDYMAVLATSEDLDRINPDFKVIGTEFPSRGLLVTAPGQNGIDFISRCFFPNAGIDEDPVTGSAHTTMAPYWSKRLEKVTLQAIQMSKRQGHLQCTVHQEKGRVELVGQAVTYLIGEIGTNTHQIG